MFTESAKRKMYNMGIILFSIPLLANQIDWVLKAFEGSLTWYLGLISGLMAWFLSYLIFINFKFLINGENNNGK